VSFIIVFRSKEIVKFVNSFIILLFGKEIKKNQYRPKTMINSFLMIAPFIKKTRIMKLFIHLLFLLSPLIVTGQNQSTSLKANGTDPYAALKTSFQQPPASARPWVYYFPLDGNLTKEGITADFEAMARVGIGGIHYMEVDCGAPKGKADFAGPE